MTVDSRRILVLPHQLQRLLAHRHGRITCGDAKVRCRQGLQRLVHRPKIQLRRSKSTRSPPNLAGRNPFYVRPQSFTCTGTLRIGYLRPRDCDTLDARQMLCSRSWQHEISLRFRATWPTVCDVLFLSTGRPLDNSPFKYYIFRVSPSLIRDQLSVKSNDTATLIPNRPRSSADQRCPARSWLPTV